MTHCYIISAMVGKPWIVYLKTCVVKYFVVKTNAFICISNPMSCAGNNYKLLLNDQNEFGVSDMIEWKMKYIELNDNVYVLKELVEVGDGFKECVGFRMEEVEAIIEDICLN